MEHLNVAQVSSLYGVHMGEYAGDEGVTSMMALMTQHDEGCQPQGDGGGSIMAANVANSFSSFHGQVDCLLSAAATAMFEAHKLQHLVPTEQTPGVAVSVSSAPLSKTEGCPRFQFRAENCLAESTSMQLVSPVATSLASHHATEPDSPHLITRTTITTSSEEADEMKAKILAHPQYPCLLEAYIDCQKVGAPPEVVACLDAAMKEYECRRNRMTTTIGMDPELDRFMEAYCEMLIKYYEELTKPFNEAMAFFKKIETQLNSLSKAATKICHSAENDEKTEGGGSSDDEDCSTGEMDYQELDRQSEDRELKDHLVRKYSGYLSSLKQEFMKKKKNGKLPKDARQKLLDWWNLHYKWPYPSETDKANLAESTGLDQKQINNWFINQRKRHWKPPEDMPFMAMDSHGPHGAALYVEGNVFHLDC